MKSINPYIALRDEMVRDQLMARGIHDAKVLAAMRTVAREAFVPGYLCNVAYADRPLPIGEGQTISQPYMVASMTEALGLQGGEKALELGTGSGYSAAVLAHIAGEVHTVERIGFSVCATVTSMSPRAMARSACQTPLPTTHSS